MKGRYRRNTLRTTDLSSTRGLKVQSVNRGHLHETLAPKLDSAPYTPGSSGCIRTLSWPDW